MQVSAPGSGSSVIDKRLLEAAKKTPHLSEYIQKLARSNIPMPAYYEKLDNSVKGLKVLNLIYPVTEQIYIHINSVGVTDGYTEYIIIDPPEPNVTLSSTLDRLFAIESASSGTVSELQQKMTYLGSF